MNYFDGLWIIWLESVGSQVFEVDYWDYEKIHYEFLHNRNFYLKIKKFIDFQIYDEVCHCKTEED